eukprot:Gb_06849 [translate_table: standard]
MAEEGYEVLLNVYDLSQGLARQLSTTFLGKAIEGIWHTGVVVYGNEYYFGGGIQYTPVGKTPYGKPLRVVELGVTHVPKEIFEDYLQEISPRYTAETYSLLHHNCNNFSNELAQFLVGCSIPDFILRLPEEVINSPMGALILPMIQQFETTLRYGGVPQVPQGPQFGASPIAPNFVQHQATSNVASNPNRATAQQKVVSEIVNQKPLVETEVSSLIPPAVEPVMAASSDASVNSDAKEVNPRKSDSSQTKQHSTISEDDLRDARARIQEEITREFASIMATGSLRASEAAALAARRVMEKHGRLNVAFPQS